MKKVLFDINLHTVRIEQNEKYREYAQNIENRETESNQVSIVKAEEGAFKQRDCRLPTYERVTTLSLSACY